MYHIEQNQSSYILQAVPSSKFDDNLSLWYKEV